jgi:quinol monooxygenase YgiN
VIEPRAGKFDLSSHQRFNPKLKNGDGIVKTKWSAVVAAAALLGPVMPALASTGDSSIYQVSEINVLPTSMGQGSAIHKLYQDLIAGIQKQPGLVQIEVTQQIGQPYNFTLIEKWKDRPSLDAAASSDATHEFEQKLQPLLSGPVYQRVFKTFQ